MFSKLFGKNKSHVSSANTAQVNHPTNFDELIEKATHHTQSLQVSHAATWRMGEADRFNVDLEKGIITWVFDGEKTVTAPATLIGTWSGESGSFLWGWDHPMSPPANSDAAISVKTYADKHAIDVLQDRKLICDLDDSWTLAATAVLLGDLQGVYRAPAGNGSYVYIGFGSVTLSPANA